MAINAKNIVQTVMISFARKPISYVLDAPNAITLDAAHDVPRQTCKS